MKSQNQTRVQKTNQLYLEKTLMSIEGIGAQSLNGFLPETSNSVSTLMMDSSQAIIFSPLSERSTDTPPLPSSPSQPQNLLHRENLFAFAKYSQTSPSANREKSTKFLVLSSIHPFVIRSYHLSQPPSHSLGAYRRRRWRYKNPSVFPAYYYSTDGCKGESFVAAKRHVLRINHLRHCCLYTD